MSYIIFCGVTISGLLLAPEYSPANTVVGCVNTPPFASLGNDIVLICKFIGFNPISEPTAFATLLIPLNNLFIPLIVPFTKLSIPPNIEFITFLIVPHIAFHTFDIVIFIESIALEIAVFILLNAVETFSFIIFTTFVTVSFIVSQFFTHKAIIAIKAAIASIINVIGDVKICIAIPKAVVAIVAIALIILYATITPTTKPIAVAILPISIAHPSKSSECPIIKFINSFIFSDTHNTASVNLFTASVTIFKAVTPISNNH